MGLQEINSRLDMRDIIFRGLEQVEDEIASFLELDRLIT